MACIYLCTCWSPSGRSSTTDHSSSNVNGDTSVSKSHASLANGYICKDCSIHSQEMDSLITRSSSSSSSSQAAEASTGALSSSSSPFTSVYSRDRSQRSKTGEKQSNWRVVFDVQTCSSETNGWRPVSKFSCDNESIIGSGLSPGVLVSISKTCMHYSQRALAPVVSLVTLLFHNVLWLRSRAKSPPGKGIHQEMFFALHPVPIILSFSSSVGWLVPVGIFHFRLIFFFQPVQNLQLASHLHSVWVCFCFTCVLGSFPLTELSVAPFSLSLSLSGCLQEIFLSPTSIFPHPVLLFLFVPLCARPQVCALTNSMCGRLCHQVYLHRCRTRWDKQCPPVCPNCGC